jgi:hypothetical protein
VQLRARGALLALFAAALTTLAGCDNPACVFGGTCGDGGSGGIAGEPAEVPADHAWVLAGAPTITGFFPKGTQIHSGTPIAITFSESMAASTLSGAIRVSEVGGFGLPVALLPAALVGDGRALILIPATALTGGTAYDVHWAENRVVTDLQGAVLLQAVDRFIGTFTVAASDPPTPAVMTTWPVDGAKGQSTHGQIVVVFDRKMNAGTITPQSFVVTVDGQPPALNPPPQQLLILGVGGPVTDTRVWLYRSVDNQGNAVSLGTGGHVQVVLSPTGNKILDAGGGVLAQKTIAFDLAAIDEPLAAEIVSVPTDAIGIDNLGGGSATVPPLEVAVTLADGQPDDRLGVFLFGSSGGATPKLFALFRDFKLENIAFDPISGIATLGEAELDIASSTSPVQARFADGTLAMAFRLQRGTAITPVRLLDTDPALAGPQHALLDTTRPKLVGLGATGTGSGSFRSDLRDLALVGRASEELRSVEVSTALGSNGMLPTVVGSRSDGLFVAAPVPLGVLDPASQPLAFTARLFDRALNESASSVNATFTQLGASGPGAALPGNATVDVEVFDARTLLAVSGALVLTHEDVAGSVSLVESGITNASGKVTLTAGVLGETLVSVDAIGYDLFTFHGVPSSRLSVPLAKTGEAAAQLSGEVSTTSTTLPTLQRFVRDARFRPADEPLLPVQPCTLDPLVLRFVCPFGPRAVFPGRIGALGFVGIDPPPSAGTWSAQSFLRAFALELPLPQGGPAQALSEEIEVDQLLDQAGLDPEERALDGPAVDLLAAGTAGIDLAALSGAPRVAVLARSGGIHGRSLTGSGVAFDVSGNPVDTWLVRCAIPGAADPSEGKYPGDEQGKLVLEGTIERDLRILIELRDASGNRAGRRPRFLAAPASLAPLDVPTVSSPPALGHTGGPSFDLVFANAIPDSLGQGGLYRATLTAPGGRRWVLWRPDQPDGAGAMVVHVPDVAAGGGAPLANGSIACSVAAFAWPSFAPALFSWGDVEREHDAFSESGSIQFTQP